MVGSNIPGLYEPRGLVKSLGGLAGVAVIHFLVKVFSEEAYADKFLRGEMYANRLSWFKRLEGSDGRGDEYEAASMLRPDGLIIRLEARNVETGKVQGVTVPADDLAAPPILQPEHFDHINLFCMYAAHSGGFHQVSDDNIEELRRQLEIPGDCLKLGRHAVAITNRAEFVRRVKMGAQREGYGLHCGLVKYYDPEVGTPLAPLDIRTIFTKREKYAYQKEFRFAIDTGTTGCEPITLDIGAIDDIATRLDTADINRQLSIGFRSANGIWLVS